MQSLCWGILSPEQAVRSVQQKLHNMFIREHLLGLQGWVLSIGWGMSQEHDRELFAIDQNWLHNLRARLLPKLRLM